MSNLALPSVDRLSPTGFSSGQNLHRRRRPEGRLSVTRWPAAYTKGSIAGCRLMIYSGQSMSAGSSVGGLVESEAPSSTSAYATLAILLHRTLSTEAAPCAVSPVNPVLANVSHEEAKSLCHSHYSTATCVGWLPNPGTGQLPARCGPDR